MRSPAPQRAARHERLSARADGFSGKRIHFMGAGGIGVSALMELCAARGAIVSGCDCSSGGQVPALRAKGLHIITGHSAAHAAHCDELVYSAAVEPSHPEVRAALRAGKAVSVRMHMLGRIARGTRAICITGAHGKTTTTWLIANMLIAAGRDPSVLLGGVARALGGNVRIGRGAEFVAETDESDNRLHEVVPSIPVLTNIDNDHLEHYGSIEAIEEAIARFMGSTNAADPLSVLIGCGDDPRVRRVLARASEECRRPFLAYGLAPHCDVRGMNLRAEELRWRFDVLTPSSFWPDVVLPMPGEHNVLNALAAISAGWHLRLDEEDIRQALATVERVGRRFEIKGLKRGVRVIDDYGHHPAEIALTLRAARQSTRKRLGVLFQPHRYTRTAALMDEFAACFEAADALFLLPVYAASEEPIPGADHHALAETIRARGVRVVTADDRAAAVGMLLQWAEPGDTVVTQGAGDVTRAADELVSRL
ncbi:MAG: UDP-N-acetylmuramate--L-alanine ligase [Planctomycetota bacterium]|nr:UDP-N-acetylmuramate--L-alanine ligase [Planctomycetota bacterium]